MRAACPAEPWPLLLLLLLVDSRKGFFQHNGSTAKITYRCIVLIAVECLAALAMVAKLPYNLPQV
jgi:hypothetical protein